MPAPFYLAVKGTTSGAPGTGSFTPNAAVAKYRAWSTVPSGWIGLVRYDDTGDTWEYRYSYWNGTVLTRTSGVPSSSSGSALTLTAAATATMVVDPAELFPHMGSTPTAWVKPTIGVVIPQFMGLPAPTLSTGSTQALSALATTNYLTEQQRNQITSVTTASGLAGWTYGVAFNLMLSSTAAGRGGWEFMGRFGCSVVTALNRVHIGATSVVMVAQEPSALTGNMACIGKDTGDTNLQFLVNSNAGSGTKIDTGIPLVANGWYECSIWTEPGSLTVHCLLIRLDTGAIYYGNTATDVPVNGALMVPTFQVGIGTTTGTGIVLHPGIMTIRTGS